ncbi:MAG: hypothetical protein C0606_00005 [Hyphomicrobiales bacterium]|nr:MAG: hypothetical protein C0606_00005 [Hyphomicrobiales bacterium]
MRAKNMSKRNSGFAANGRGAVAVQAVITGLALATVWSMPAVASDTGSAAPALHTNQAYVEEVTARSELDITNTDAVFDYAFAQLPDVVKVYPTENYYYFRFAHNGVIFSGNFRFDTTVPKVDRVYFAYFETFTDWRRDEIDQFKGFSDADGVKVEKLAPLVYSVTSKGKTVRFELNDLTNVKPPEGVLNDDERYLGPVFDESGVQFYLVYNAGIKNFLYVLNEQQPIPDELYALEGSDRTLVGRRTGFAFYKDDKRERKILVGVHSHNVETNTYLDGPFDQLPDNFIVGDELKEAILEADPSYAGQIDRFGVLPGGEERFLIAPYMSFTYQDDLLAVPHCTSDPQVPASDYYNCFIFGMDNADEGYSDDSAMEGVPADDAGEEQSDAKAPAGGTQ